MRFTSILSLLVLTASYAGAQTAPANFDPNEAAGELSLDPVYACACGCGVFDVATSSMLPTGRGGMLYLDYDYQNQDHNRAGNSSSASVNNNDKDLRTNFFTAGVQYMFNRRWGIQVDLPVWQRHFETFVTPTNLATSNWTALGDIRLRGIYTGFSEDMSIGATFGVKLPTGNFQHDPSVVDRDAEIGTGSTDLLFGGFFRHQVPFAPDFTLFAQAEFDIPVLTQDQYRPGIEFDAATGIYFESFRWGRFNISPVGQIIISHRASDGEANAAPPPGSGYDRVILSPGLEIDMHPFMLYGDVEFPVYQHFTGDQLAASVLCKVILSYAF